MLKMLLKNERNVNKDYRIIINCIKFLVKVQDVVSVFLTNFAVKCERECKTFV